jgi:hypothetical protein
MPEAETDGTDFQDADESWTSILTISTMAFSFSQSVNQHLLAGSYAWVGLPIDCQDETKRLC